MQKDYFVDANRGNDAWDGLSPIYDGTHGPKRDPKAFINGLTVTAGEETRILLADDSTFVIPWGNSTINAGASFVGSAMAPIIIGKYSPSSQSLGQKPHMRWNYEIQPGDWVDETGTYNAWSYTPPFTINQTCLVRINDTWMANCVDSSVGSLTGSNIDGRYGVIGGKLYLYAPPGQDPTTYYGKVLFSMSAHGIFTVSGNRRYIIEDLHFVETAVGVLTYPTGGPTHIELRRLSGYICSGLITLNAPTTSQLTALVHDCEIENFGSYGIVTNTANQDGYAMVEIYQNKVWDGIHNNAQGGIYLTARDTSGKCVTKVWGNEVWNCRYQTQGKLYDGCGIYAEVQSDKTFIYGNHVHDCYMAFQDNSGRETWFMGNLVTDCYGLIRVTDAMAVGSTHLHMLNNTALRLGAAIEPQWAPDTRGPGLRIENISGATIDIRNNILHGIGDAATQAAIRVPNTVSGSISTNCVDGFLYDVRRSSDGAAASISATSPVVVDVDAYVNTDGTLKVSPGTILDTLATDNPLAVGGEYIQGVRLFGGHRADPRMMPVGACEAVLPRRAA